MAEQNQFYLVTQTKPIPLLKGFQWDKIPGVIIFIFSVNLSAFSGSVLNFKQEKHVSTEIK